MPPSSITPTVIDIILLIVFSIPIAAVTHTSLSVLVNFVRNLWRTFLGYFPNDTSHYLPGGLIFILILAAVVAWILSSGSGRYEYIERTWKNVATNLEKTVQIQQLKLDSVTKKYETLKKNVSEASVLCGQDTVNADGIVSQHAFCSEYRNQEKKISVLNQETIKMRKEIYLLKTKPTRQIVPTPEYIEAMKSRVIQERDSLRKQKEDQDLGIQGLRNKVLDLQRENERLKKTDKKDVAAVSALEGADAVSGGSLKEKNHALKKTVQELQAKLTDSEVKGKAPEAAQKADVAATVKDLEDELSKKDKELKEAEKEFENVMVQYEEVVKDRENFLRELDTASKSNSVLEKRIVDLEKDVHDKTSKVDEMTKSAGLAEAVHDATITRLQERIATLEASQQSDLISAAPAPANDNTSAIAGAQAREVTAKADLQAAHGEIERQSQEIADLTTRVNTPFDVQASAEYRALQAESQGHQQERIRLEAIVQRYSQETQVRDELIESLRTQVAAIPDVQSSREYQDLQGAGQAILNERDELARQLRLASDQYKTLEATNGQLSSDLLQANATIDDNKLELEIWERIIKQKSDEIEAKDKQLVAKDVTIREYASKPLIFNPIADKDIFDMKVMGKDTKISRLEERVKEAEDAAQKAREEARLVKEDSKRAAGIYDQYSDLLNEVQALKIWLDQNGIGNSMEPLMTRLRSLHDDLNGMISTATDIRDMLDAKDVFTNNPATGVSFDLLGPRVEALANEYIRLMTNPANKQGNAMIVDPQSNQTRELNAIRDELNNYALGNPNEPSVLTRCKEAFNAADDAAKAFKLISDQGLFDDRARPDLVGQVTSVINGHHRNFRDEFINEYSKVAAELNNILNLPNNAQTNNAQANGTPSDAQNNTRPPVEKVKILVWHWKAYFDIVKEVQSRFGPWKTEEDDTPLGRVKRLIKDNPKGAGAQRY